MLSEVIHQPASVCCVTPVWLHVRIMAMAMAYAYSPLVFSLTLDTGITISARCIYIYMKTMNEPIYQSNTTALGRPLYMVIMYVMSLNRDTTELIGTWNLGDDVLEVHMMMCLRYI